MISIHYSLKSDSLQAAKAHISFWVDSCRQDWRNCLKTSTRVKSPATTKKSGLGRHARAPNPCGLLEPARVTVDLLVRQLDRQMAMMTFYVGKFTNPLASHSSPHPAVGLTRGQARWGL